MQSNTYGGVVLFFSRLITFFGYGYGGDVGGGESGEASSPAKNINLNCILFPYFLVCYLRHLATSRHISAVWLGTIRPNHTATVCLVSCLNTWPMCG